MFGMTMRRFTLLGLYGLYLWQGGAFAQTSEAENAAALPEPVAAFIEHCYEANRLTGRAKRPEAGSGWRVVPRSMRDRLNITDNPAVEAYIRTDVPEEEFITLAIYERILNDIDPPFKGLRRNSCRLTFVSSLDIQTIYETLVDFFDGTDGADKTNIINNCEYEKPTGWQQWLWMAMPEVGTKDWNIYSYRTHNKKSTCIMFTERRDYYYKDLVGIHLLSRKSDPNLFVLNFDRTFSRKFEN